MIPPKVEIDIRFLPVGNSSHAGDAICIRWGYDLADDRKRRQFVMVVDAGDEAAGGQVVDCVRNEFASEKIDLLVLTHPHDDHLGGIAKVSDSLVISNFLVRRPWRMDGVKDLFKSYKGDGYVSAQALREYGVEKIFDTIHDGKGFANTRFWSDGVGTLGQDFGVKIDVLGPSCAFYETQLRSLVKPQEPESVVENFASVDFESLTGNEDFDAVNSCSYLIALSSVKKPTLPVVLLTGDATVDAQREAFATANGMLINFANLKVFQLPHHGSIRNSRAETFNAFLGRITSIRRPDAVVLASVAASEEDDGSRLVLKRAIQSRGWAYKDRNSGSPVAARFFLD